ncbi:MAG TPA: ATP-binding protein [Actinocrinis sp.]|nr:ATP-binding protein [Actinocrinis sp.]
METRTVAGPDTVLATAEFRSGDYRPATARTGLEECLDRYCPWVSKPAVLLVASELITNAVRHTCGDWTMQVTVRPAQLVVEVTDGSQTTPTPREPDLTGAAGGMGMHIISKLTTWHETEVSPAGTGKTIRAVWQEVPQPTIGR